MTEIVDCVASTILVDFKIVLTAVEVDLTLQEFGLRR